MLQKLKLAISGFTGCVLLFVLSSMPARLSSIRFLKIESAIEISLKKESPSYIVFAMMNDSNATNLAQENFGQQVSKPLLAGDSSPQMVAAANKSAIAVQKVFAKKIVLDEMKIERASDDYQQLVQQQEENERLLQNLSPAQRKRVEMAQAENKVLEENWNEPVSFADEAKELLAKSGALASFYANDSSSVKFDANESDRNPRKAVAQIPRPKIIFPGEADSGSESDSGGGGSGGGNAVASAASGGRSISSANPTDIEQPNSGMIKLWGPIEITGGLAVTDQHHLEIRRIQEGIPQEIGRVDLVKGHYAIDVPDLNGIVTARLVDKNGRVWGDGSLRLASLSVARNPMGTILSGPRLKVEPRSEISGSVATLYSADSKPVAPASTTANFMKGAEEKKIGTEGSFKLPSMSKGSSTIARVAAPKFLQSTSLLTSGHEGKIILFPENMIQALREIVSSQRQMSMDTKIGSVVWGAVKMDGKPVRGLSVRMESVRDAQVVYLNEMMLPDPSLQVTSANGLYVFLNVEEGFHSVSAFRGDEYFGHANVIVEEQAVALGDIESSTRSEPASIKVFDAFTGQPVPAQLMLQGKGQQIAADDGSAITNLPQVSRLSMLNISTLPQYLHANYFYNDMDAYIHIPLVQESWVMGMKSYRRLDDMPGSGLLIGFVPNSNYEVYLAGEENFDKRNIVYFDYMGRPIAEGQPGGGFILFNVPSDVHEVVVMDKSDRIQSQVVPVDSRAVSVLRFSLE